MFLERWHGTRYLPFTQKGYHPNEFPVKMIAFLSNNFYNTFYFGCIKHVL